MTTNDHPLTEAAAAELTKKFMPGVGFQMLASVSPEDLTEYARLAYDAGREHEREHADPHRDPRPWQDCTREDICAGDLVEARDEGILEIGIAHHQGRKGDWYTELGYPLTSGDDWPLRRIPAPTPPAEEITLPTEHPAHITDVETEYCARCAYMALHRDGDWCGVDQEGVARAWPIRWIAAFTLPDGTRARRDGENADGTPRFVKVQEAQA